MGRIYNCSKCGLKHEKPTGKKCQHFDSSVIALSDDSSTEPAAAGMKKVLKTLGQISERLDKLEKQKVGNHAVNQANSRYSDAGGDKGSHVTNTAAVTETAAVKNIAMTNTASVIDTLTVNVLLQ